MFDTFKKTMSGKTTKDKVAEAGRKAMGGKPKPKKKKSKPKTRNVSDGNRSVDYYEG